VSNGRLVALGISLAIFGFGQAEKQYSANGTVRNARTGEPVQDVRMSIAMMPTAAQISDPFSGKPWDPHAEEVLSGSAGEFRFERLPAGLYVYEAQKPGFALYRATFTLPAVPQDPAIQVNLIPLVDKLDPPPHPLFKIQGKIQGYLATKEVNFYVLRGADRTDPIRTQFDVHTGTFEILDVAPGEYTLRAAQEKIRGEVQVTVGSADVSGVSIALLPSTPVQGVMRSAGGRPDAIRYPNPCNVNLSQDWSQGRAAVYVPRWQQDDHFTLEGVFPGEYQVRFLCFGAYIQSASFGTADLLGNPVLMIPANGPLPSLEIDYTPGGGSLQVKLSKLLSRIGAVLLVPAFPAASGPELKRVIDFGTGQPDDDMVQFSNLSPGGYTIYTFPNFEDVHMGSPEFLRNLSGGIRVHVEDGEVTELSITGTSSAVGQVPFKN
jgi:hypothetical protein